MKGFLKFGVLALVLVLVSGCGSSSTKGKVLTCTMSENSEGMDMAMTKHNNSIFRFICTLFVLTDIIAGVTPAFLTPSYLTALPVTE